MQKPQFTHLVAFQRLRANGFQVVDRPRPRSRADTLATNHGGLAAFASPGIRLSSLDLDIKPTSFELLPVRVVSGSSACVVVVVIVYRTGPVMTSFFTELSDVMDRVVTHVEPVYVVGDLNIRLDRPDNLSSRQLTDLLSSYGLSLHVSVPTHDRGGLLDVVASRRPTFAATTFQRRPSTSYISYSDGRRRWLGRRPSTR